MDKYVGKMLLLKMIQNNGIIDINFIPAEAFEFCYDTGLCKKIGIMITNTIADNFNLSNSVAIVAYEAIRQLGL